MSDAVCSLFNSGKENELKRCAFLTVKYHNPKNLVFQNLHVKRRLRTHTKTKDYRKLID